MKHAPSLFRMTPSPTPHPPIMIMFPRCVCYHICVKPVVYMKQGPRSGIFSVYIWRNVDYILLTYSCPQFCVLFFFFIGKCQKKSCLVSFHTLNYVKRRCVCLWWVCCAAARGMKMDSGSEASGPTEHDATIFAESTLILRYLFITCTCCIARPSLLSD